MSTMRTVFPGKSNSLKLPVMFWARVFALTLIALAITIPASAQAKPDYMQLGREYTKLFTEGDAADLWLHFSAAMKDTFTNSEVILGMHLQFAGEYGPETALLSENVVSVGEFSVYQREVMFQKLTQPMTYEWSLDAKGVIVGFYLRAAVPAPSRYLDYKDKTNFRLPFKGNWIVLSGGGDILENRHASAKDQRFAYDLLAVKGNKTFSGSGTRPGQHYCFGKAILAPADGTVFEATDGIPDNVVNAPFPTPPAGNHVIIDHGHSEYSVLAHLKLGSVRVKPGDKVVSGQKIGQCGNSGNSPTPHLHFHLQNTPVLFMAEGLPIQFHHYLANKQFVESGEPARGQVIRNSKK
jgi:murein DD-endopeptidase MepM/ murein hydrolase activator NlpD